MLAGFNTFNDNLEIK
ncbi:hypothetical protein VCHENC02_1220A, partial [Vibrio harveyi]